MMNKTINLLVFLIVGISFINAQQIEVDGGLWVKNKLEINPFGANMGEWIDNEEGLDLRFYTNFIERFRISNDGKIQIYNIDTINTATNVIARLPNGTLSVREVSSLFSPETDPIFTSSPSFNISQAQIVVWNDAIQANDFTDFSAVAGIPNAQIVSWIDAYNWGNHADAGYVEIAERDLQQSTASNEVSTTSNLLVDMPDMSLTTSSSGEYLVYFNAEMTASDQSTDIQFVLNVDGVDQTATSRIFRTNQDNEYQPISLTFKTEVLLPSKSIKIRWNRTSGSGSISTRNRIFILDNQ